MRDAFFDELHHIIAKDKNTVILTADHGAFGLKKIEEAYPEQYINVGIAEQALISVAAGLAKCGKKVYVYAINNFVSLRVLEQINIDLCAMNLDVNIIGSKNRLYNLITNDDEIENIYFILNNKNYLVNLTTYYFDKDGNIVADVYKNGILLADILINEKFLKSI